MNTKINVQKLTFMAMFTALSIVLVALIHFPIFPGAPFLEYDPADIPILIATFVLGPVEGLVVTAIACLIQGLTVSAGSGVYGIIMHFLATGSYVLVAGIIYRLGKKNWGTAAVALAAGTIAMTLMMMGANLIVTPIFMKVPVEDVKGMLLPIFLPFNLIKAAGNGLVTFLVYKQVGKLFEKIQPQRIAKD